MTGPLRHWVVYARKGAELALRTVGIAPELLAARRLRAQVARSGIALTGRRVLMLSPRDWVEHVQNQAMLAQALRLRGADVTFATCGGGLAICDRANTYEAPPMPCTSCSRYTRGAIRSHGFPVVALRDLDPGEPHEWPELDGLAIDELSHVKYRDLDLGQLTDIPVKWFLCAADLDGDPLVGPVKRSFLRSARQIADSVDRLLEETSPDVVVMLSGLFLFEAIAWELCRQRAIDTVTYERAFLKDTLVFSRAQPAGRYDLSEEWESERRALSAVEEAERDAYLTSRRSGGAFDQYWTFDDTTWSSGEGQLAVLFTNLTWDTAVIGRDVAFDGIRSWVDDSIRLFADRPRDRLVIRVHPSEVHLPGKATRDSLGAYVERQWPDLPPNVSVVPATSNLSSYSLMAAADLGLVYTSTTGLELALSGTPVVVAGETHYRGKGFTNDVVDRAHFRSVVTDILDEPSHGRVDVELARQYAYFFFFRSPFPTPGVTEPLPGLARLLVHDLRQMQEGANPELDRLCRAVLLGQSFQL